MRWIDTIQWLGAALTQGLLFYGCWQLTGSLVAGLFLLGLVNLFQFVKNLLGKIAEFRAWAKGNA